MSDAALQAPANSETAVDDKALLIAEVVVLQARQKAIKELIEVRKARLLLLMTSGGDLKRQTNEGTATRGAKRKFLIHDRAKLAGLFTPAVLLEAVKVDAAFYDAAKKAAVQIDDAVMVESDASFKIESRRTAVERERISRIMDETRLEMDRRVEQLARRMIDANAGRA